MVPKTDNSKKQSSPPRDQDGAGGHNTKPVWKEPRTPGGHRLNELFNRFRQIIIELKGLSLTELAQKKQNTQLEKEILNDFVKLERKYLDRQQESDNS